MTGIDNRVAVLCDHSTFGNYKGIAFFGLHLKSPEVGAYIPAVSLYVKICVCLFYQCIVFNFPQLQFRTLGHAHGPVVCESYNVQHIRMVGEQVTSYIIQRRNGFLIAADEVKDYFFVDNIVSIHRVCAPCRKYEGIMHSLLKAHFFLNLGVCLT